MDPRRKKIYIIVIIVCFTLSGLILGWNMFFSPSAQEVNHPLPGESESSDVPKKASGDPSSGFTAPEVFPATDKFNLSVINSEEFKKLLPHDQLDITGQLGRSEPFKPY